MINFRLRSWSRFLVLLLSWLVLTGSVEAAPRLAPSSAPGGLAFVANAGQFDARVRYQVAGADYIAWVLADAIWLAVPTGAPGELTTFALSWPELATAAPRGRAAADTVFSYYHGAAPDDWYLDVPAFTTLAWDDWELGADEAGLWLAGPAPELNWIGPDLVYGEAAPTQVRTEAGLRDLPFRLGRAPAAPTAPQAGFSTFIGAGLWDEADGIAVDPAGNSYTTGYTTSITFPDGLGRSQQHGIDIFLTKLNAAGSALHFALHINPNPGGLDTGQDYGQAIAVDATGHPFLAGRTDSPDFPRTTGSYDDQFQGPTDAYVIKFQPDGAGLVFGTFINGQTSQNFDDARALRLDEAGNVYVGGGTFSLDLLPAGLPGYRQVHGGERDGFVVKLAADGSQLLWGTFLGGDSQESVTALALGADGAVYAGGWTRSLLGFPTTLGAYDASFNGQFDGFVTVLEPSGTQLRYSTFVGGSGEDRVYALDVLPNGRLIAAGMTVSPDLPATTGAFDTSCGSDGTCNNDGSFSRSDGFVLELTPAGDAAVYLTFLGGELGDEVRALDLDPLNRPVLTGRTESTGFPVTGDAIDNTLGGDVDAFLTRLNLNGDRLDYSAFLGGSDWDAGLGLQMLGDTAFLTGWTRWSEATPSDFPVTAGSYDESHNGDYDIFITTFQFPAPQRLFVPIVVR
ncbi:MAG: SBBP repeat-containing protein [Anaerolineales bacterium]|nr:SBBP repeat-containing protein [Anaerolineales bacterium]